MNSNNIPTNMSVTEAASYLRLSKTWLDKSRIAGGGPRYVQYRPLGRIIYRRCDLDEWLSDHTLSSTSEASTRLQAA